MNEKTIVTKAQAEKVIRLELRRMWAADTGLSLPPAEEDRMVRECVRRLIANGGLVKLKPQDWS